MVVSKGLGIAPEKISRNRAAGTIAMAGMNNCFQSVPITLIARLISDAVMDRFVVNVRVFLIYRVVYVCVCD